MLWSPSPVDFTLITLLVNEPAYEWAMFFSIALGIGAYALHKNNQKLVVRPFKDNYIGNDFVGYFKQINSYQAFFLNN